MWKVIAFESSRRERPVEEFIKSLDPSTIAKIAHVVDLLEAHGPHLGMPHAKKISPNLYELRVRGKQEVRIVYAFIKREIFLLHAFKKKRRKIPRKEINVANQRLKKLTEL